MTQPFATASASIPVTLVTRGAVPKRPGAKVIRLQPALHEHAPGSECVACAARSDIRTILFDLLQVSRKAGGPMTEVLVDATALSDPQAVATRLDPGTPALGLRDHTVLRSFHLASVV